MGETTRKVDVVIAGAGVTGCLAARMMSAAGFKTLLLEKKKRHELGHDWWDTMFTKTFEIIGIDKPVKPELQPSFKYHVYSQYGYAGFETEMPESYVNIDRKLFGQRILGEALKAGAEFIEEATVKEPVYEDGTVKGLIYEAGGQKVKVLAPITFDASGMPSVIRGKLPEIYGFNQKYNPDECVYCYREIREVTDPSARSILVVGEYNGVKWLCRNENGHADIFSCVIGTGAPKTPKEIVYDLIRDEGGVKDEIYRGGQSAVIPVRRAYDSCIAPGLLLVGDTACNPNPLNGSGMSSGLLATKFACEAAIDAFKKGSFGIADLWSYNYKYKTEQDFKFAALNAFQYFSTKEDKRYFHTLMCSNLMNSNNYWGMEDELTAPPDPRRLKDILPLMKHPGFFYRTARTFLNVGKLVKHYKNYPETYDPATFEKWQARTKALYAKVQ